MKKVIENTAYWVGILVLGIVVGVTIKMVGAWVEPGAMPPGGNIAAPLNTSNVGQSKQGGLTLNIGGATYGLIVDKGLVGIKTTTPQAELDVNGDIRAHNLNLNNNLNVGGDATINGNLNVNGAISCNSSGDLVKTVSTGWKGFSNGENLSVSCSDGYIMSECSLDYYDTNSGVQYHGYGRGTIDKDGKNCTQNISDGGITEGQLAATCLKRCGFVAAGAGTTTSESRFGNWETGLEYGKTYKAETDGVVVAKGGYGYLECRTDNNNPPTTVVQTSYAAVGYGSHIQATFPVRKGDYWMAYAEGLVQSVPEVRFLPLGN